MIIMPGHAPGIFTVVKNKKDGRGKPGHPDMKKAPTSPGLSATTI
jgi:hypothetical protein